MKRFSAVFIPITFGLGMSVAIANAQQAPVNVGSDSTFAVLAGTTVTVTGGGTITGNVGISRRTLNDQIRSYSHKAG